jgi:SAM-dependent methyltransferase
MSEVEEKVRAFYDTYGWVKKENGEVGEVRFRQFSNAYLPYHEGVNQRTLACFSGRTGKLLIGGGGDLPETHTLIASQFAAVTCLDISQRALDIAKTKLADNAEYIRGSLLEIPKPANHFDAAYCAHVIYHIDRDLQERAVDELIRVTRPNGRIVIVYSNPHSLFDRVIARKHKTPVLWKLRRPPNAAEASVAAENTPAFYSAAHPLQWWKRFESKCQVTLLPWDAMSCTHDQELLWNESMAAVVYRLCRWFERKHPARAAAWWDYPLVVLDKRSEG